MVVHPDPMSLEGKSFLISDGVAECVEIVKQGVEGDEYLNGVPAGLIRRGPAVDENTPYGAGIGAGFNKHGWYLNKESGNHMAWSLGIDPSDGGWLGLMDQWPGSSAGSRWITRSYDPGNPNPVASGNGNAYYILLWPEPR